MTLQVSFRHMQPSNFLRSYVAERSLKLGNYFHGKFRIIWNLSTDHLNRVVHGHVIGKNMDYFAKASNGDFFNSIDETVEKLEKQIRKHKEIVHRGPHQPHAKSSHMLNEKYLNLKNGF